MLFDFIVPGNGFFASSLRVAPNRVTSAFSHRHAAVFLEMAEQRPAFHAANSSTVSACGSSRKASSRPVSSRS